MQIHDIICVGINAFVSVYLPERSRLAALKHSQHTKSKDSIERDKSAQILIYWLAEWLNLLVSS